MDLENLLQEFRTIRGYIASSILSKAGEEIASDLVDTSIDAALLSITYNDIFNMAHECVEKMGSGECTETNINTRDLLILMHCSGKATKVHFHLGCILAKDGNSVLAGMLLEKVMKKAAQHLG